jgi:predicted Zn-dependent peptidase
MIHTVTEHTLSTGTKGLLIDVPGSEVVNILIRFNSGFQFSPEGKYELSHFVEHLIADGNKDYPSDEAFKVEITKNGAYRNAYTNSRVNGYIIECAAFELPRILDLLVGYLGKPLFPQESFATELNNVREELNRFTTEPMNVCGINLGASLWPGEVKELQPRLDQLDSITIQDVRDFYARTHTAKNMRFYVAGDLSSSKDLVLDKLNTLAELLPEGKRLAVLDDEPIEPIKPVIEERDLKSIYYGVNGVSAPLNESERRVSRLMRSLLFGGYQGRIYGPMRQRGLAYTIGGSITNQPNRSELHIWGYVTKKTIQPLFELVATEFDRLQRGDLTQKELRANLDLIVGSLTLSLQTSRDLLNRYAGEYDLWGTVREVESEFKALERITVDEVIAVARKLAVAKVIGASYVGSIPEGKLSEYTNTIYTIWK